jgi:hypothetical protein
MFRTPIDVWDIETFDDVLLSHLRTETSKVGWAEWSEAHRLLSLQFWFF